MNDGEQLPEGAANKSINDVMATAHNELAFHTEVPARNWSAAEDHYRKAISLLKTLAQPIKTANVELNLQALCHLSGQEVDLAKVRDLTEILEQAGDPRAKKGHELLKEIS